MAATLNINFIIIITPGNAAGDSQTQGPIDKAVKEFSKQLLSCVVAKGGYV